MIKYAEIDKKELKSKNEKKVLLEKRIEYDEKCIKYSDYSTT